MRQSNSFNCMSDINQSLRISLRAKTHSAFINSPADKAGGELKTGDDSMSDFSTRSWKIRRQGRASIAAALAAVLFLGSSLSYSATRNTETPAASNNSQSKTTAHEIAIEFVKSGSEGLELSARLSERDNAIVRDIGWVIRAANNEVVFDGATAIADAPLPPGDYAIEISYGSSQLTQSLTLLPGNRLSVSFILDVGGIRILPRVKGIGLFGTPTQSWVYAVSGDQKGQLITISERPGEILRVSAGAYRIESRFAAGNAFATADVKVKAGVMSAVEIDHLAGLARLSYIGAPDKNISWNVKSASGEILPAIAGLTANYVLKPGKYIAEANAAGELLSAKFDIAAGQERDIILGN